jgi:hypothetical protein
LSVSKSDAAAPPFTIANGNGVVTSEFKFSLPDASRLWIHDFDLDSSGAVVFCGQCYSSEGQLAPFIAIKSRQASGFEVIRTAPFFPWLLSVAPDGTFYVAGREKSNLEGHVIRHLTRTGSPIASMFPASQFQTVPQRMESGYLVATAGRIGWYSPIDGEAVYVEMSPDLSSSSLAPGIAAGQGRVLGFALTESGGAYLTWGSDEGKGLPNYMFDRTSNRWNPMSLSLPGEHLFRLRGQENGRLVFRGPKATHFVTPITE